MAVTMSNYDAMLKEYYHKKRVANLAYTEQPFMAMLPKNEAAVGDVIVVPVKYSDPHGRGATFSSAQANKGNGRQVKFNVTRQRYYSFASVDNEAIYSSENDGAFEKALKQEIDRAMNSAAQAMEIQLFRNGSGSIGQISSGSTVASTTITLADTSEIVNFEVGSEVVASSADGGGSVRVGSATVTGVDRDAGTVTTDANWSAQITGCSTSDYLFVQGDPDLAISGLADWLPLTAPSAGESFFGVDRSVDTVRLSGVRYTGTSDPVEEVLIELASRVGRHGGRPDTAFVSFTQFANLEKALGAKVSYAQVQAYKQAEIGFKSMLVHGPAGEIKIVPHRHCPNNRLYMLQMDTWHLLSLGMCPRFLDSDGLKMLRESDRDGVEVRCGWYAQLACDAPGKNGVASLAT